MTASLIAPMPVRCPATSLCFLANASRPFITSWPVRNTRRYVFASPSLRRAALGRSSASAEDSPAPVAAGAATASPAAAKKHRRVIGSNPESERAIVLSFPRLRFMGRHLSRAVRDRRHHFLWKRLQARCQGMARKMSKLAKAVLLNRNGLNGAKSETAEPEHGR